MPGKKSYRKLLTRDNVNEPELHYPEYPDPSDNKVTISSFNEQEEANYRYWLNLTPEQRFELHYKLITQFYADVIGKTKIPHDFTLTIENDITS
ncbi:MAG: hypothetical protein NT175_06310 [Bacteroidetes bacterium]|nr:hypothetical protein [Bacteroidota bacterium]